MWVMVREMGADMWVMARDGSGLWEELWPERERGGGGTGMPGKEGISKLPNTGKRE